MARVLTCIDPAPAEDGSCAQHAWIEQGFTQYLPTTEQAVEVGGVFFASLLTLRAAIVLLKPPKGL